MVAIVEKMVSSFVPQPSNNPAGEPDFYLEEGLDYLSQAFWGNVERRVLAPGQDTQTLLGAASRDVAAAARVDLRDIDALIVCSSWSKALIPGDAAFLADSLGLDCPAWNVSSTCNGAMVAMQTACALVRNGTYRNILIAVATSFSHAAPIYMAPGLGDGGAAILIGEERAGRGFLAAHMINTKGTIGSITNAFTCDANGVLTNRLQPGGGNPHSLVNETLAPSLRACTAGALRAAGVSLDEIELFCFSAPTAWYAQTCARILDVPFDRTLNLTPIYGHLGVVAAASNLYHAAQAGRLGADDLVMIFTYGMAGTAGAAILRWGDVALGPAPAPPRDPALLANGQIRLDVGLRAG
jgi:3-oxoacyl-[acyl-carrier-protein] synthase-3